MYKFSMVTIMKGDVLKMSLMLKVKLATSMWQCLDDIDENPPHTIFTKELSA